MSRPPQPHSDTAEHSDTSPSGAVDTAGATPVMAQYLALKAAHPDSLLFFRMGDFFELFFDDAVQAAEALAIALTKRGKHGGEEIPMCGVPVHNAERYLHELIRKGFRVAVAEQLEDPAEAKKRGYKAVVKRDVVRLVTPGTLTEDSLLDHARPNYLAAFADLRDGAALAYADVSTGALRVAPCTRAELGAELARLAAAEIVLKSPADAALAAQVEELGAVVAERPAASFDAKRGATRAAKALGAADLEGFGQFEPAEAAALGALIDYLDLTQKGRIPLMEPPRRDAPGGAMRIDAATRRNLEITRALSGDARAGSLLSTVDRTRTSAGARLLEARLASPSTARAEIAARLDAVQFFLENAVLRETARDALKATPDMERALARLGLNRGGPRDLASLRDGLAAAGALKELLSGPKAGLDGPPKAVADALSRLEGHDALASELHTKLVEEPPMRLSDGGAIASGVDKELDQARALRDDARKVIAALEGDYRSESGVTALKIKHNNVLGYFIETPASHGERMMSAPLNQRFRHRQTLANAVRFTTDRLAELEADIARAGVRAAELERAAFDALAQSALARAPEIRAAALALAEIDVAAALAQLAESENWRRPEVDDSRAFRIIEGRHPVVEAALKRERAEAFVANNCDLSAEAGEGAEGAQPIWLVTGPNMAGKSTYLRQNALIAILAQAGSFVPAREAHIGVVDQLFSRVGASDDLARGRSTFMVEMVETAAILNQAGDRALVILDEIGRGTATYDGLSIAWSTLEHLHDVNTCRGLFATHYHELTALSAGLPGLKNVTVAVREWKGDVVFLREIVPGSADRSYGVQVARLAGMPRAVVARAKAILKTLEEGAESPAARAAKLVEDLPLFATAVAAEEATAATGPSEVETRLAELDPDTLTPREALDALYALKKLLE